MVLAQKMTHPPISCEKSFESSYWRVGTFTFMLAKNDTARKSYSQLLKLFAKYIIQVKKLKSSLEYQKSQHRRSVETLGLSGNGDAINVAKKGKEVNKTKSGDKR